jgi:hypothetical protein
MILVYQIRYSCRVLYLNVLSPSAVLVKYVKETTG